MSIDRHHKIHSNWTNKAMKQLDGIFFGEWMNKGSNYEGMDYIIFDAYEIESKCLVGTTFAERYYRLSEYFSPSTIDSPPFATKVAEGVGLATVRTKKLTKMYHEAAAIKILEGIVLKNPDAKLKHCVNDTVNSKWQVKVRKPSKCYAL